MKKMSVLLFTFFLIPMLTPVASADAIIGPEIHPVSGSYSATPWLLIAALAALTLLILFKFRKKK